MNAAILVIFTVVAGAGGEYRRQFPMDWRPIGSFETVAACKEAERLLGVPERTRCLPNAARGSGKAGEP